MSELFALLLGQLLVLHFFLDVDDDLLLLFHVGVGLTLHLFTLSFLLLASFLFSFAGALSGCLATLTGVGRLPTHR